MKKKLRKIVRVYVAGPYTVGDCVAHTRKSVDASQAILKAGMYPFSPHLTLFWHYAHPNDYETWMDYDFHWLEQCDALLRLPGLSKGADREVAFAKKHGIRIFDNLYDLIDAKCEESHGR